MGLFELILTGAAHLLLAFLDIIIVFLITRGIVRIFPIRVMVALDHAGSRLVDEVGWIVHTWWVRAIPRRPLSSSGRESLALAAVLVLRALISFVSTVLF